MVPRFGLRGRSFIAYTWGSPFDRHDKTGKSSDFSLKTDMLFRLLASTQSGIIPDKPDKSDSRTGDVCFSFPKRDSQRLGNYLWISLRWSHSSLARCQP